jgi:hypothetical protein
MSAPGEGKSASPQDFQRQGRAALRVMGKKAGENRWARAFYSAGRATAGSVGHVAHSLWLEVTGFLFIVLALIGGGATVREYQYYAGGKVSAGKLVVASVFTVLFLYFGIESFVRSRRTSKKK